MNVLQVLAVLSLSVIATAQAVNAALNLHHGRLASQRDLEDEKRCQRAEADSAKAELIQVQVLSEVRLMREAASRSVVDARRALLAELLARLTLERGLTPPAEKQHYAVGRWDALGEARNYVEELLQAVPRG